MYRLFSQNTPLNYLFVLIVLLLLRARLILSPEVYVMPDCPELLSPLWTACFGDVTRGGVLFSVLAIVTIMLVAVVVNSIVNSYRLTTNPSTLGAFCFVVLSAGFKPAMGFQPIMVFALLYLLALERLFSAMRKSKPYSSIAWAHAITTIATLFWARGVWFLLLIAVLVTVLNISSLRAYLSAFFGVLGALVVSAVVFLFMEKPGEAFSAYLDTYSCLIPHWKIGWVSITYMSLMVLYIVFAVLSLQRNIGELKIMESRRVHGIEWSLVISALLMALPRYSYDMQILVALSASLLLPMYLQSLKTEKWRDIHIVALVALTAWMIY